MNLKKLVKRVKGSISPKNAAKLERRAELNKSYAGKTFEQTLVIQGYARCCVTYVVEDFYIDGRKNIVCHMKVTKVTRVAKSPGRLLEVGHAYGISLTQFMNQFRSR